MDMEFSYRTRTSDIEKIKGKQCDVLIVGGGITGAGVANILAANGLNVVLAEKGFEGEIMAHLSHLYREGACIYFTFIIKGENELELLQGLRDKLIRTFMANGGSVTHHHGKGRFFLPYMDSLLLKVQESYSDPLLGGDR